MAFGAGDGGSSPPTGNIIFTKINQKFSKVLLVVKTKEQRDMCFVKDL